MRCEGENPSASDHKGIVSTYNNDLSIISKITHVASPFKSSQQMNRRIDTKNKACVLEYPRKCCVTVCEADDRGPSDCKEQNSGRLLPSND
ncbi:hypothetical protein GDO78_000722 [Eleutherodactylus coqui]|uniref:Uncharacterized protein n=1 Tax=Eleutherodactylus coqui TaxID=57060 RepID=A0A8J6FRJ4_ELECQ|nr:hypothetical protein GDO78_000722 [Eleutherodactylus coqui]KAG9492369.1 hypothetical protein GDO78_000722 [Eleutherodactylus coqui]